MVGPRRRSREIALQILHQTDVAGADPAGVTPDAIAARAIARYFEHLAPGGDVADDDAEAAFGAPGEGTGGARIDRALIEELVGGVCAHRDELDDMLTALSRNWRLERMAIVERNVIRIALYELKYCPNVPVNVVLNEAVELAKRYGTAEGAAFVNGLLDRAVGELSLRP